MANISNINGFFIIDSGGDSTFAGSITVGAGNSSIQGDLYFGVNADIFKNSGTLKISTVEGIEYQVRSGNGSSGDHIFKSYNTAILTLNGATNNSTFAGNITSTATSFVLGFNVTDNNSFMNINHTGNEAWEFRCQSIGGSKDFVTIGASGGGMVGFGDLGDLLLDSKSTLESVAELNKIIFRKLHPSGPSSGYYDQASIRAKTYGGYSGGLNFYTNRSLGGGSYGERLAMVIDNFQQVGIGLTSPAAKLDVLQEARISYAQGNQYRTRITNTDGNTRILSDGQQCNIIFGTTKLVNEGTAEEKMRLTWQGYLGIGTDSPGSQLETKAPDTTGSAARTVVTRQLTLNANGGNSLQPYEGFGTGIIFEGYDYAGGGGTSGPRDYAYIDSIIENSGSTPVDFRSQLKFHTNPGGSNTQAPTVKMVIEGNGNVGIGTTTPDNKLQVAAGNGQVQAWFGETSYTNAALRLGGENSAGGRIYINYNGDDSYIDCYGGHGSTARYRDFTIAARKINFTTGTTSGSTKMVLTNAGRLALGDVDAQYGVLEIETESAVAYSPTVFTDGSNIRLKSGGTPTTGTTTGISFGIGGAAELYFGAEQQSSNLAHAVWQGYTGSVYQTNMRLTHDGTLTVKGDLIAYGSPSDKRLKENIKPIESALDKVCKLEGVTFDWKKSDSELNIKEDIGFIAQDVQKVLPELVRENDNGMLSMRHQGIAPILLEAIKELKQEIEELKNKPCNCNCK